MSVVMATSEWVQRDCHCSQKVPGIRRGCKGLQRAIQECPGGTGRHLDMCCAPICTLSIHYGLTTCYTHVASCRSVSLACQHSVQVINSKLAIMFTVAEHMHVACMGEERGVYRVLMGKQEGRRPLGRPRCRWVDNIRKDLGGEGVYRVLVGKLEGRRPLGRPRRRWVDNIRVDLWGEGGV